MQLTFPRDFFAYISANEVKYFSNVTINESRKKIQQRFFLPSDERQTISNAWTQLGVWPSITMPI